MSYFAIGRMSVGMLITRSIGRRRMVSESDNCSNNEAKRHRSEEGNTHLALFLLKVSGRDFGQSFS